MFSDVHVCLWKGCPQSKNEPLYMIENWMNIWLKSVRKLLRVAEMNEKNA